AEERPDPFDARSGSIAFTPYYQCNYCHTTFPLGDLLVRNPDVVGRHAPRNMHFAVSDYLAESHPKLWSGIQPAHELPDAGLNEIKQAIHRFEAPQHAVSLGITCESCHLGSRAHAEGKLKKPAFFPRSPHLRVEIGSDPLDFGRTQSNVNWACGRCHSGNRRQLAGGMATWNSTEYTDAMRGSCYSQLKCIDCHDPHRPTGKRWTKSLAQTDSVCLKCHQEFQQPEQRMAHTHHSPANAGSSCLNCHMPHLNEGLQDVVRTHMIFSPTDARMIESNQPNACNQCHTERGIDWTLQYLKDWYHKEYSESAIAAHYSDRKQSAALGWLQSTDQSVRLLGADALVRTRSRWALSELIGVLDDPFLMNRQFGRVGLEPMLGVRLADFGYQFYMTADERREPLRKIRETLLKPVSEKLRTDNDQDSTAAEPQPDDGMR
ncbi:MAG: cytochrome c3 family protein, partial [Planctomycetaceae bacterium]